MKKIWLFSLLSTLMTIGISSCSCATDENPVTRLIPADAVMVAHINGSKMCYALDVKIDGETIEWPEYLKSSIDNEMAENMLKIRQGIDYDNIYYVILNLGDKDMVCLARVTDYDAIAALIKDDEATVKSDGDYESIVDGSAAFVIYKKQYVFLVNVADGVTVVKNFVAQAEKNPLSKSVYMAEALSTDNAMTFTYNYDAVMKSAAAITGKAVDEAGLFNDMFIAGALDFVDNKFVMETSIASIETGESKQLVELDEINIALLSFVPEDFNIIIASGKPNGADTSVYDNLIKSLPLEYRGVAGMVLQYMSAIDGSTLLALNCDIPELMNTKNYMAADAIFMAHLPMEKILEISGFINQYLAANGLSPEDAGNGLYHINLFGKDVYYGAADGYLALSTVPLEASHSNSLTKYFVNRRMAAAFDGKCLDSMLPFYPFAVMQSESGASSKLEVTLEGTSDNFLPAIIKVVK